MKKEVDEEIRDRLAADPRPLKEIARGAGVPYEGLRLWYKGEQVSYDVRMAAKVWRYLTGTPMIG